MSKTSEYIEQYKDYAAEQMKRYGIPASVTLAQGILESANGKSQLSRECNNHFGIKASKSWLQNGGQYRLFDDDKPNEKFCLYASVADSYEHHSKILANSDRYKACFKLSPDDYRGWTAGLQKGGYATNKQYASSLNAIIQQYHLDQYDQQVMTEMKKEGKKFGIADNPLSSQQDRQTPSSGTSDTPKKSGNTGFVLEDGEYSLPVRRDEFMLVTSKYGNRKDPVNSGKMQFHQGIDIKTKSENVLATENGGKVIKASNNVNTGGGKTVVIEYDRGDGTKTQCVYMHLSNITVKVGDTVKAGQPVGVSGNTGTRTTGEHLHFGVRNVNAEGKQEYVNPAAYLAEISARGNLKTQALYNGKDLLASYTASNGKQNETVNISGEDWMKKLLSSEDAGNGMGLLGGLDSSGGILAMAFTLFTSLMALASQVEGKTAEEKMEAMTEAALNKTIDLKSLVPSLKSCTLHLMDNGKMILQTDNGQGKINHELTEDEQNRLSTILHGDADTATKQQKVSSFVNGVVISQQASMNYEQISEQQSQQQTMQRK